MLKALFDLSFKHDCCYEVIISFRYNKSHISIDTCHNIIIQRMSTNTYAYITVSTV